MPPSSNRLRLKDHRVSFREPKDSLRLMLAQISPAYDREFFESNGIVRVSQPDQQAERIMEIILHAHAVEADVLLFPELSAPSCHLRAFEEALAAADRDLVACLCYEHTSLRDLVGALTEEELRDLDLPASENDSRLVNFCRIFINSANGITAFTQIKLTPYSSEFSLSARETMLCGTSVRRFVSDWGNFLFLICKDYVGEIGGEGRVPMFDFLKSLTHDGLHYVFVPALNSEPAAFLHAARAFYYLQEKSSHTFTTFLNAAELDNTAVVFPVRPHPRSRGGEALQVIPLFENKPAWGTQILFPGTVERLITASLVRLDTYTPLPGKMIFSPVHQAEVTDLSELGIATLLRGRETSVTVSAPPPPPIRHNLPPQPTAFVGREGEVQEITERLADPACRLLTLTGQGGVGKSRLAAHVACDQVDIFRDGVYFVPLAPLRSAEFLVPTIADVLSLQLQGTGDAAAQLLDFLREKRMLLLLDNFEHLLEGAGLLSAILRTAAFVKLLVTSRERLSLTGEWILEVAGLDVPARPDDESAETYSAVQLFVEAARRVRSDYGLSLTDRQEVVAICRTVEGMPLAIELAASWVRVLSCSDILGELERGIDFLASTARDMPDRHRSLSAVFEHSWSLLSDEERGALMRLSVFRGGFRREAAGDVAGASLLAVSGLVDKSLLRWDPAGRYEMHNLLRQYAGQKLCADAALESQTKHAHSAYYARYLQDRERALWGAEQGEVLQEIGEEIENVRQAWAWAVGHGCWSDIGASLSSLCRFYDIRGWLQEATEVLGSAAAMIESGRGPRDEAERDLILGRVLTQRGGFLYRMGKSAEARGILERSLGLLGSTGAVEETIPALRSLGSVARLQGDLAEAGRLYERSLQLATEKGSAAARALALSGLGHVARQLGHYDEARRYHRQSLGVYEQIENLRGKAVCSINLANVAHDIGEYEEAERLYQETLTFADEIGDRRLAASALNNLGTVASRRGDYEECRRLYARCLAMAKELGDRRLAAMTLGNLGSVCSMLGDHEEASRLHEQSLDAHREIGDKEGVAYALSGLGDAHRGLGSYDTARRCFREALAAAVDLGATPAALEVFVGAATLFAETDGQEDAVTTASFVMKNPAAEKEARQRAGRIRSAAADQLSPEAVERADAEALSVTLEQMVSLVLAALGPPAGS
jgi:predicted ATPase/Tfp pilus assembly protein PilF/predicted amidohydrolase